MLLCQNMDTLVSQLPPEVLLVIILKQSLEKRFAKHIFSLTDDHDALKFLTYSLQSPDASAPEQAHIAEDERAKLSQEYQEYQDKLQKQKDE